MFVNFEGSRGVRQLDVVLLAHLCLLLPKDPPCSLCSSAIRIPIHPPPHPHSPQAQKDADAVDKVMKELDENGDGEVDFQEYVVLVAALTVACNNFFWENS